MDIYFERIKPILEKSGLTDKQIEETLQLPRGVIYKWGTGKYKSYKSYIPKIASYFHVSTDYLLGNTDDPRPAGQEKASAAESGRTISEKDIQAAFFGGADDLSDEEMDAMWNDAKDYIQYKLEQRRRRKDGKPS